jgi:hypothetical protein
MTNEQNQAALQEITGAFIEDFTGAIDAMRADTSLTEAEQAARIDALSAEARQNFAGVMEAFQADRAAAGGVYQQSLASSQQVREAAVAQYQDVAQGLQALQGMATNAEAWLESAKNGTLNQLSNTTAQQMEQFRTGLRTAANDQMSQEMSQLQAMGFGLDSPAAVAAASRIAGQTREQIGQAASAAYATYVDQVRQTNVAFGEMGTSLRESFGADMATGLQALGYAGGTLTEGFASAATQDRMAGRDFTEALDAASTGMLGTSEAIASVNNWASVEHGNNIQTAMIRNAAIDGYELSGQQVAASMASEAMQDNYVMSSPFLSMAYDVRMAEEQWEQTQFWNNITGIIGVADFVSGLIFSGPRGGHMKEPKQDSGLTNTLIGTGGGIAGSLGMAAIIKS